MSRPIQGCKPWIAPEWAVEAYNTDYAKWPIKVVAAWSKVTEFYGYKPGKNSQHMIYMQALMGDTRARKIIDQTTLRIIKRSMLK